MKIILLSFIALYQQLVSPILHMLLGSAFSCRFEVTCSSYARNVIKEHGAMKGVGMALRRLLSCQPFGGAYA